MLNKDQILKLCDLRIKEIDVPELGGTIRIRELTLEDAGRIYAEIQDYPERERGYQDIFRAVASSIVDEKGELMFTTEEVASLGKRFSDAITRIYNEIILLCGGKNEDAEKNSEAAQTVNS
jgi:hypothetical protein